MNTLNALEKWIVRDARRRDEAEWREQEKLAERLVVEWGAQLDDFLFRVRQALTDPNEVLYQATLDPRTPAQVDADQDADEWRATYESLI